MNGPNTAQYKAEMLENSIPIEWRRQRKRSVQKQKHLVVICLLKCVKYLVVKGDKVVLCT